MQLTFPIDDQLLAILEFECILYLVELEQSLSKSVWYRWIPDILLLFGSSRGRDICQDGRLVRVHDSIIICPAFIERRTVVVIELTRRWSIKHFVRGSKKEKGELRAIEPFMNQLLCPLVTQRFVWLLI